jgi:hypothetical protein
MSEKEDPVFARMLDEWQEDLVAPDQHRVSITEKFRREFNEMWRDPSKRLALCPPKDLISSLNKRIDSLGKRPISARKLAKALRASEVPDEMTEVLWRVERSLIDRT